MHELVIVYPNEENTGVVLCFPAEREDLTVEQIAQKDVPSGVPYRIIKTSELPEDYTFRDAWQCDFTKYHDIGYGPVEWMSRFGCPENYHKAVEAGEIEGPKSFVHSPAIYPVITESMSAARMIWRAKMAIARDNKIADMNRLYQIYIDNGLDPAPVVERRSELRSVTQDPAIDAATTPEELKAVWPSILDDDV